LSLRDVAEPAFCFALLAGCSAVNQGNENVTSSPRVSRVSLHPHNRVLLI
jgi:hypothetical protein